MRGQPRQPEVHKEERQRMSEGGYREREREKKRVREIEGERERYVVSGKQCVLH